MILNLRNSEIGGSISNEHKATGLISRLRAFMSHIGTLLTEAPDRYYRVPNQEELRLLSLNKGCSPVGSGTNDGASSDDLHEEELKAERERRQREAYKREQKGKERIPNKKMPHSDHGYN